jgi:16S rRNA (guanine527-N7)-methyltransferase
LAEVVRLTTVAVARGYPSDEATLRVLVRYLEAVLTESARVNLTSARTLADAVAYLALSALAVTRAWDGPPPTPGVVVDLGTGNGLPGVAAALAWPEARVLLVERRAKKARAVDACLARVGIVNAETVACDGRELSREKPQVVGAVDLVTVRAVGRLDEAATMAAPWLAPGGRIAHWKGAGLDAPEREAGDRAAGRAGLSVLPDLTFMDDAGPARLVRYERRARSPGGST